MTHITFANSSKRRRAKRTNDKPKKTPEQIKAERAEYQKQYYLAHREKAQEYQRQYNATHKKNGGSNGKGGRDKAPEFIRPTHKGTFNSADLQHAPAEKTDKMLEQIIKRQRYFTMQTGVIGNEEYHQTTRRYSWIRGRP